MHNAVPQWQAQLMPEHEWRMTMIKGLLAIAAAAGALVAGPAIATTGPEPVAVATTPAPVVQQKQVRYCAVDTPTGSFIPRRICKTRADWLKEGVDPAALR
jgi:hypothetical protein